MNTFASNIKNTNLKKIMMMEFWNSLEDSTKIILLIAAVGWVVAIWQSIIAFRNRKSSVIFENRLRIYNEYFAKIDNINERLIIDFSQFIGPTVNHVYKKILIDPENSTSALIDMQQALSDMISKSSKTITQATQELQALRFIASKKTLKILDEYKALAESQTKLLPELLGSINVSNLQIFDIDKNSKMKEVGQKLIETRDNLEN